MDKYKSDAVITVKKNIMSNLNAAKEAEKAAVKEKVQKRKIKELREEWRLWSDLTSELDKLILAETDYDEKHARYLSYIDIRNCNSKCLETCEGDIRVIIEALADYCNILSNGLNESSSYKKAFWQERINRIHRIQKVLESFIVYDRDIQMEICKNRTGRQDDVGEEALSLLLGQKNQ